jgi:hypothetical protein
MRHAAREQAPTMITEGKPESLLLEQEAEWRLSAVFQSKQTARRLAYTF